MKYTKEERLDIGRRIYDGEFTIYSASQQFEICTSCARDYMRSYRDINHLPVKTAGRGRKKTTVPKSQDLHDMHDLEAMTKEELIQEVVKSRIAEARLKKGYEVKGDGSVILYDSKNTR